MSHARIYFYIIIIIYIIHNFYGPKTLKLILVKYAIFTTSKRKVSGELRIDRKVEEIGCGYCLGVFPKE